MNYKINNMNFNDKSSLVSYIKTHKNSILIDGDGYEDMYTCLLIENHESLAIGLAYYDDGLEPKNLLLDKLERIIVAVNNVLVVIDWTVDDIIVKKDITFTIFELFNYNNKIIVIHELGVLAINKDCEELWSHNGYYSLHDYSIKDGLIQLIFEGEEPYDVDLDTGIMI